MIKWFSLHKLAEESGLPYNIIKDAADKGKLITKIFGTKDRRTTNEEFQRWSRTVLYEKKKEKYKELIQDQAEHNSFLNKIHEIHNKYKEN